MILWILAWSLRNRGLVLIATLLLVVVAGRALPHLPLDALPDLSDVQVIVHTTYPGQAPRTVEDQVTYPLTTTMMSVPGAKTVRGYSFFGDSFVYVLFEDGTDLYWARSRVMEYLNQGQGRLPQGAKSRIGPDAAGLGWVYEYALVDRSGTHDLSDLRALQDWFLKYELKAVPNVAEVASLGGMVRQYQVVVDPDRLRAYQIPLHQVLEAVKKANQESGGAAIEIAEAEYMVRAKGYLTDLADFRAIPVGLGTGHTPILLQDVATIQLGPELRRGIAELDGEGEVVGGIVIMRSGKNALNTIRAIKERLAALKKSLPAGVEVVPVYDRSLLIGRAIRNLVEKLMEEFLVVTLVCVVFLFHIRSALVAIVSLPLGVGVALLLMGKQGVAADIMSLGGIAIAIGAMVDAAIVMIENAHKHLEHWHRAHPEQPLDNETRWGLIHKAAAEVAPALVASLLVVTISFIPVFSLEAQEGRLFAPLAYTKTYAMAAAAFLSITLVPVLMGYAIRGRIPAEGRNPLNRFLIWLYRPGIKAVLRHPRATLAVALLAILTAAYPLHQIGSEFLPPLDEGNILYMPSALPGLSVGKAAEILQETDRLLRTVPEVAHVFGKMGRADTATDPAPMEMMETIIEFKPKSEWRPGMTPERLQEEMEARMRLPGLANVWIPPIRNRINMLATGVKSAVGIKIAGHDPETIDRLAVAVERIARAVPGVASALAERIQGGRYVEIEIDRVQAARFGLNIADVQEIIRSAVGGETVGETVMGLQRFPIAVRYPREVRDSLDKLEHLPILTEGGAETTLGQIAHLTVADGPALLKSENARLTGWIYVDLQGRDLASTVQEIQGRVATGLTLPPGYSLSYSGQFEFLQRAKERLLFVVPLTVLSILLLLYLTFRRLDEAILILATLPFSLVGGSWLVYLLGHNFSVATAIGFIALAGVAAEFGIVMLLYLKQALARQEEMEALGGGRSGKTVQESGTGGLSPAAIDTALLAGAVLRVRPKAMTVAVILAGLFPILLGHGTGSELMQRIAAPMVGGMITAPLLSLFVLPAAYRLLLLWRQGRVP